MQITRLEIYRYKNLHSFRESFSEGINLIEGPNEAGKSSLVEAITDLFFSDPASSKKELRAKVGWDSDQSFELNMEFTNEGETWRLHKDFENGQMVLTRVSDGEEISDKTKIMRIIESSLGMANRDIFLATTTIRQDEIGRVSKSSEAIKDKLEGLITGGREEILASEALGKIEDRIRYIKKDGHKHLGYLQQLEKNKGELIYELDKTKREIDQIAQNRLKLKENQSLLDGITTEYAAKKSHMEKAAKAAENEERLKGLEERFQDLNNRVKSIQSSDKIVNGLKEEIANLPKIDSGDLTLAEEQSAQIRYLERKKEPIEDKTEELAEQLALSRPGMFLRLSAVFLFMVSAAAGAYYYFISNLSDTRFLIGGAATFALFIVLAILWSGKAKSVRSLKLKYDIKQTSLEELESDLESSRVTIETLLEKYSVVDVPDLKTKYENYRDLEKEIKNEVRRYDSWLDGKTLKELERELQTVTKDLAIENETARELKIYSMDAEETEKLNVLVEALAKQKSNLEANVISLKRQLEFAESGCELQASLEERLENIETTIERAKHQVKIYEMTREFIEKARKNVLKASLGVLEQETSQILNEVTNGKYSRVKFDRQSLRFEVFSPEKDDWINPDRVLSRGARDQLYLAARMALVRIISEDRKPVLIFDEPFLTFDRERRLKAMNILKQYSDLYQIFILTCNSYYSDCAGKKISLMPAGRAAQTASV